MLNTLYSAKKSVCAKCLVALCAGEGEGKEGRGRGGGGREGRGGEGRGRGRVGNRGHWRVCRYAHRRGRDTVGRLFVAEKGEGNGEGEGEGRERETEKVQNKKLPWSSVSHC